jgi:hypothetical protein
VIVGEYYFCLMSLGKVGMKCVGVFYPILGKQTYLIKECFDLQLKNHKLVQKTQLKSPIQYSKLFIRTNTNYIKNGKSINNRFLRKNVKYHLYFIKKLNNLQIQLYNKTSILSIPTNLKPLHTSSPLFLTTLNKNNTHQQSPLNDNIFTTLSNQINITIGANYLKKSKPFKKVTLNKRLFINEKKPSININSTTFSKQTYLINFILPTQTKNLYFSTKTLNTNKNIKHFKYKPYTANNNLYINNFSVPVDNGLFTNPITNIQNVITHKLNHIVSNKPFFKKTTIKLLSQCS